MKYTQRNDVTHSKRIAVIGGGPAGMMAAGTAVLYGANVTIFEHMPYLGKKLGITGKGRCNVTNSCSTEEFMQNVTRNPRFLYSSLSLALVIASVSEVIYNDKQKLTQKPHEELGL